MTLTRDLGLKSGMSVAALLLLACFAQGASAVPIIYYDADMRVYNPVLPTQMIALYATDNLGSNFPAQVPFTRTYTITNFFHSSQYQSPLNLTGAPTVELSSISGCGATVSVQPATFLTPGSSTTFTVSVTPTSPGAVFGFTISISNDDPTKDPYVFSTYGQAATAPEMDVEFAAAPLADGATQNVGNFTQGQTPGLSYTIKNAGSATLGLSAPYCVLILNASNCAASVSAQPSGSIGAGQSAAFTVNVTLASLGAFSFDVNIASNDADENPYNWTVNGNTQGVPGMDVQRPVGSSIASGSTDALGSCLTGGPANFTWTIASLGSGGLNLTGSPLVEIAAATNCSASVTSQPSAAVATGQSTQFSVQVTPAADGAYSFRISISNDDAAHNPYIIDAAGVGYTPKPDIDLQRPAGSTMASGATENVGLQTIGTPAVLTYTLANLGNLDLHAGAPAITSTSNCTASVVSAPAGTVAPNGATTFGISVTVQLGSAFSFSFSVASDDPDENPYVHHVQGVGANVPEIDVAIAGVSVANGANHFEGAHTATQGHDMVLEIANTGLADLHLTAVPCVSVSALVNCTATVTTQPASTVAASSAASVVIHITPLNGGPYSLNVAIQSDDGDEGNYTLGISGSAQTIGLGGAVGSGGGGCSTDEGGSLLWAGALLLALAAAARLRRARV